MEIQIKPLRKDDYSKVIDFAIIGMNFNKYLDNKVALRLYGRYFLYLELERASRVIAAYIDDQLVGVLMVDMKNEQKVFSSFWRRLYVKAFQALMRFFVDGGPSSYDDTNKTMLSSYLKEHTPDGEICFLAADPDIKGKGIGTLLLNELAKREKDKLIYLYTDSNCTYQFYEKKGFKRAEEREIQMELTGKDVPLTCFLYSKRL